jgi:SAM-dependent methyltransferase
VAVTDPNQAQREHWVDLGRDWTAAAAAMEHRLGGWGEAAIEHVGVANGERAVDIGCGAGGTTISLARAVGDQGAAVGLDISATMLVEARQAAAASGLANVTFEEGDAQIYPFEPGRFDLAFSRFGVMFFADPVRAFANVGRGLRAGGRLGFACWGLPADNPAQARVRAAVARVVDVPPIDLDAPGPHSLGTEAVLRRVLGAAGFVDLRLQLLRREAPIGGTARSAEEMVDGLLMTGPARDVVTRQPQLKPQLAAELLAEFGTKWKPGGMWLPAAVWMVAARWAGASRPSPAS